MSNDIERKTKQLSVRLRESTYEAFRKKCHDEWIPMASAIEILVREDLARTKKKGK